MSSLQDPTSDHPDSEIHRKYPSAQVDDHSDEVAMKEPLVAKGTFSKLTGRKSTSGARREEGTQNWPSSPSKVTRKKLDILFAVGTDAILMLAAAVFFIFPLIVLGYNGKAVDEHLQAANNFRSASRIGPTVFPILFAAVLGRLLNNLMAWRLERGERLGLLDLLARSTTLGNTILTQICSMPSLMGMGLIIAWALSPLGGQASLRVFETRNSTSTSTVPVKYMSNDYEYASMYSTGDLGQVQMLINGLFNSALLGPERVKTSPVDTWNNVKIPMIETLTTDSQALLKGTWISVPEGDAVTYTSLIGYPLSQLPAGHDNTLSIETSYIVLDCPILGLGQKPPNLDWDTRGEVYNKETNWYGVVSSRATAILSNGTGAGCLRSIPDDQSLEPRFIAYDSYNEDGTRFGALCTLRTSYVEVELRCTGQSCISSRIRNSTTAHAVSTWTLFDGTKPLCEWFTFYTSFFLSAAQSTSGGLFIPVDGYLINPNSPASPLMNQPISQMDRQTFALRLGQLFNSFLLILAGPYVIPYGFDGDVGPLLYLKPPVSVNVTAQSIRTFEIIVCHSAWLTLLVIASSFLIVACSLSIALYLHRTTPELTLSWSTVIRNNSFVPSAETGSFLDDSERSRLLEDTKLMFGDVASEEEIGHLAISSIDRQTRVTRTSRERLYI